MITVRRIDPSEWLLYRDVRLRALQDAPDAFSSTYALESVRADRLWAARLSDAHASGKDAPLFALDDKQVCGLAWCRLDSDDRDTAQLFQMWVAPESRGKGAGRALLNASVAWARGAGAMRIRLGVTVGNSPATRLYFSCGFVGFGELEPLRDDSSLVVETMQCDLAAS